MSLVKRITVATEYAGVGSGIHQIEPSGGKVIVWEHLEEDQIEKLTKMLIQEFGEKAVTVGDASVILRYQRFPFKGDQ